MTKILKSKLLAVFLTVFCFSSHAEQKKADFTIGIQASRLNFEVHNPKDSIVKWRDVNSIDLTAGVNVYLFKSTGIKFNGLYGKILSGELTDDDLQNTFPKRNPVNTDPAQYSISKKMGGYRYEFNIDFWHDAFIKEESVISFVLGAFYKSFYYKPSGLYTIDTKSAYYRDGDIGHANLTFYGPAFGIEFKKLFNDCRLSAEIKALLPISTTASQTHWGSKVGWKVKDGIGKTFGVDFKLTSGFKIKKDSFLNFYAGINYLRGSGLSEYNHGETGYGGSVKSLSNTTLFIGSNFSF